LPGTPAIISVAPLIIVPSLRYGMTYAFLRMELRDVFILTK